MTDVIVNSTQDSDLANKPSTVSEVIEITAVDSSEPLQISRNNSAPSSLQIRREVLFPSLQAYLIAVIFVNLSLLFLKGYTQDLGYWHDWVKQLSTNGYLNFNGNYPPFYIHWLYLLGKFYSITGMPLESNNLLKFLTQIPVLLSHFILTIIIFSLLTRFDAKKSYFHIIMMLTVLNPTILINGPIWGQVDLIPVTIVLCAFILSIDDRFQYLTMPMFVLALLTKFQMIAFAPVFGFIFFRNPIKHLLSAAICFILGAVVFMPSIMTGHFWRAFHQAYIDTLGQYPLTTFNAANIWILLTGNTAPDNLILLNSSNSIITKIFTAKYFGMLLFSLIALWVFIQGIYHQFKKSTLTTTQTEFEHILFSGMICAVAFFTLLPAMHERYLFPAIIVALAYASVAQKKLIYPIALSLLCALNMLIIVEINGSDIWQGLAWLIVAVLLLSLLENIIGEGLYFHINKVAHSIIKISHISLWILIASLLLMLLCLYNRYQIHTLKLTNDQQFITEFPLIHAQQDHGSVHFNRSYDGNSLSIGNRRYAQGFGTHANSEIQYQLPDKAKEFSFMVGLDDEVGTADVQFSVWGDGKLLWISAIYYGNENGSPIIVNVENIKILSLKVAALKDDKWDHADWINTVITIGK